MSTDKLDLIWILLEYHADRVKPSIASDVKDIAELYNVSTSQVIDAINFILADGTVVVIDGKRGARE